MRRGVTVLVVVVVAAIALAAGIDAIRGDDSSPEPEAEPPSASTTQPEGPTNDVPLAGELGGTLYYTNASCELEAIELPRQTPAETPNWDECRFVLSPNGRRVAGEGSGWDPSADPVVGRLFESEGGLIQVSTDRGPDGEPFSGTAPAWRPDGTLTYFADGAVREWPSGRVLISERRLLVAAMTHLNAPADSSVVKDVLVGHMTWLDQAEAVVAIRATVPGGADLDLAAVFGPGRRPAGFSVLAPIEALWSSSQGGYWAIAAGGLQLFRSRSALPLPALVDTVAVTWSPDAGHMAVATRASVFVFPPGETSPMRRLPVSANDLAWRGEAGPPALAEVDEAGEWLGGVGATGRLFVTVGPWTDCALRALHLPGLQWAEQPPGPPSPCRFALDDQDGVHPENEVPQPGGGQVAVCRNQAVDVLNDEGFFVGYPAACAPAWRPDGRLTFIRDGGLFEPTRRLLSRGEVSAFLGRPSVLEEVAWMDDRRFWAVVRSGESAIVALMTTDELVFSPSFTTRTIEGLRVSATGMVAARTDQGVVLFDSGGRRALTFPAGQAVSWAPGELVAAVATPSEILFVAPVSREVVTVPLTVRDLEWVVA
jgi:hypothetical protein